MTDVPAGTVTGTPSTSSWTGEPSRGGVPQSRSSFRPRSSDHISGSSCNGLGRTVGEVQRPKARIPGGAEKAWPGTHVTGGPHAPRTLGFDRDAWAPASGPSRVGPLDVRPRRQ